MRRLLPLLLWWFVSFFNQTPQLHGPFTTPEDCEEGRLALVMLVARRAHPDWDPTPGRIARASRKVSDCAEPPFD